MLPEPIDWNYVFANADFMKNKTIYVTVIVLCALFTLLLLYARYKDRKDRDRVRMRVFSSPSFDGEHSSCKSDPCPAIDHRTPTPIR